MNILYCGDKPMQKGILLSSMSLIKNVDEPLNIYILTVDYREKGINYKPVDKAFQAYKGKIGGFSAFFFMGAIVIKDK